MIHCDLCRKLAPPIARCAFGEVGVDLFLHPECQRRLLAMSREEQDAMVKAAAAHNRKVVGRMWQTSG